MVSRADNTTRLASRPRRAQTGFSLLEMLIAMGVLAFMMLVLFRFFSNVQVAWTASMNTTELYENGRVALDVITRDLQSATARADDIPGQHIRFHQDGPGALWFVATADASAAANSPLVEVGYRINENRFERAFVDDTNAAWNVYGPRDDADDQDGYRRVIDGVIDQQFVCYDDSLQAYTPDIAVEETALPNMVSVILTLMDGKSFRVWQQMPAEQRTALQQKVARTFRKTIYLGGRGGETL